jgi:hypothetical protein
MSNFPPQPPSPYANAPYGNPQGFGNFQGQGQPTKTSVMAVLSLVFSLVVCVPFLGLLGMMFGIIGLVNTGKPGVSGRPLAVAGLLIGALVSIAWIAAAVWAVRTGVVFIEYASAANGTLTAISTGDTAAARKYFAPQITDTQITEISEKIKGLGQFKEIRSPQFDYNPAVSQYTRLSAIGVFAGNPAVPITIEVGKDDSGNIKIFKFDIQTTAPPVVPNPSAPPR